MIDIEIVSKRYGTGPEVLGGLRLCLDDGEFVAVLGPSGAGKTTLLQLVSGLDRDFAGAVSFGPESAARPGIGYIFQQPRLMPWLSALDNVALVADWDREQARGALSAVGLEAAQRQYPRQLSGGMQRRVALARAFVRSPELLLMDEPFVSLDFPSAEKMRGLLLSLWHQRRPAVLFVTHDLDEAIAMADRLVFLSASPGSIVLDEPVPLPRPRPPLNSPEVVAFRDGLLSRYPSILTGEAGEQTIQE